MPKSHVQTCTLGEYRGLESYKERLGFVALGGKLRGQALGTLCLSLSSTAEVIFLRHSTSLLIGSAGEIQ